MVKEAEKHQQFHQNQSQKQRPILPHLCQPQVKTVSNHVRSVFIIPFVLVSVSAFHVPMFDKCRFTVQGVLLLGPNTLTLTGTWPELLC